MDIDADTRAKAGTHSGDGGAQSTNQPRSPLSWVLAIVAVVAVVLYGLASLGFVVRGRLNADEGWYLYAGRLVWRGELPYRDFAFTQMPLLPYVYGVLQVLHASLYVGRIVSFVLGTAAIALGVRVAWREAGRGAAAAVAVLCLAFPTGIYNLTLTKTYALVAFFLAVILAALTARSRPTLAFPVAAAAATGLALTRTSGIPLACLVIVYVLWRAPSRRARWWAALIAGGGAVAAAALVLADIEAARFGLSTFHQLLWHDASTPTRIDTIVTDRIPEWLGDYWGYVVLVAAAVLAVVMSPDVRRYVRERPVYPILALGMLVYVVLQLPAGQWAPIEYGTPLVPLAITMASILVFRWAFGPSGSSSSFRAAPFVVGGAVVALAVLTVFHPTARGYFVGDSTPGSIAAANRVASYIRAHTESGDTVLALWGQPATVAAHRDLTRNVTFGLFSYEDMTTERANALHYVNQQGLVRMLESGKPAAVVLTDLDRAFFNFRGALSNRPADPTTIPDALEGRYRKTYSDVGWGTDAPIQVDVYLRNDRAP